MRKNNLLKNILIVSILFCLIFSFLETPSTSMGLDNLAYITAIGIDVGENDDYKISFQLYTIQSSSSASSSSDSSGSGSSSGDSSGEKSTTFNVNTVECNSIDSGISLMNTYLDKSIDLSHCEIIVISESLAKKGIYHVINSLANKTEIRPDCNIIISTIPKDEFSDSDMPSMQDLLPEYYDTTTSTENLSGYTENMTLTDFFYALQCRCTEPFAALSNVRNPKKKTDKAIDNSSSIDKSSKSVTSSDPSKPIVELLGLAAFKGDTFVGTLNGTDTICYLLLSNKLENTTINIPSPIDNSKNIDLNISLNNKPKIKVYINNNSPYVDINLTVNAKILSLNSNDNKLTVTLLTQIEDAAKQYITDQVYSYLNKTSKDYNSDITAIGKYAAKNFNTTQEWHQYNWLANYYTCSFKVNTNVSIKSGYILTNE